MKKNYYRSQNEFRTLNCDSPQNPQIDSIDHSYNNFSNDLKPTRPRDLPPISNDTYHSDYYEEIFKQEYVQLVRQEPYTEFIPSGCESEDYSSGKEEQIYDHEPTSPEHMIQRSDQEIAPLGSYELQS